MNMFKLCAAALYISLGATGDACRCGRCMGKVTHEPR